MVDDEQGYRDLYVFFLEPLDIEVTCAENGLQAVEKIRGNPYDLVFMDVHMLVMTGPEAVRKIRQIRPHQKVVLFSSSSDPSNAMENEALKQGSLACFYKPVTLDQFHQILTETIGLKAG